MAKQMIKRKDGSYSQRGLWDNIRANRGSGKKPTSEMLKQEKKIKNKKTGGYKSKYYTGGKAIKNKMYQGGGMYEDNTVAGAGQGGVTSTSNIVYQESNPELQAQRVKGFEAAKQDLIRAGEVTAAKIEDRIEKGKQDATLDASQAGMQVDALAAQGKGILKSGTEAAATAGLIKPGAGSTLTGALQGAKAIKNLTQAANIGKGLTQTGIAGVQGTKAASLAAKGGGQIMSSAQTGKTIVVDAGGNLVKGGSAVGAGLKSFASSGAGLGLIASGLGYGVEKLWGDDDPTTTNWAEGTGGALKGAGTGATIGSMIMPGVGTAIGAGVGALVGVGQKLIGSRKAEKAQAKAERAYKAKVKEMKGKYNRELGSRFASQQSMIRAGQMRQKTYSGYDLGQNVMAQMGGMRMGMPRYGIAA